MTPTAIFTVLFVLPFALATALDALLGMVSAFSTEETHVER